MHLDGLPPVLSRDLIHQHPRGHPIPEAEYRLFFIVILSCNACPNWDIAPYEIPFSRMSFVDHEDTGEL